MIFVFSLPETPADAQLELDKLSDQAVTVMMPENRRRLSQRRNKLNAHYDQLYLKANLHANKGDKDWQAVAERVNLDKKVLTATKEAMQIDPDASVTIY